jgi:membrane-associated phospholipid phosphatase
VTSVELHRLRARWATIAALTLAVAFALVWVCVYHLGPVARLDSSLYYDFTAIAARPHVNSLASLFASLCDPGPYDYLAAVPIAIALLRRRPLLAAGLALMMIAAAGSAELLKDVLSQPHPGGSVFGALQGGSWPSGHSTAATALSLSLVMASPARLRPYAATLGAAFSLAVVYSVLVLGWHYPSDVLGGILLAAVYAALTIAAISAIEGRRAARRPVPARRLEPKFGWEQALTPPALAAFTAMLGALALLIVRPSATVAFISTHHALLVAVAALAVLSCAAATSVALAVRR